MRIDGPHRIFAVVVGLWAVRVSLMGRALWFGFLWRTLGVPLQLIPHSYPVQYAVAVLLPAVVLYGAAFLAGPLILRWVRAGFSPRELG